MEELTPSSSSKHLPKLENKSTRDLVEETFVSLGFTDENPSDLDMVTELLDIWIDQGSNSDKEITYSPEQYILLNDPDVQQVLNKCKEYYEPKKRLSKGDLKSILEDIARGSIRRQDFDFKNGEIVYIEPTFGERLSAIKMLQEEADDDSAASSIQFINNIIQNTSTSDSSTSSSQYNQNMDAPKEPPKGHYSLTLEEPLNNSDSDSNSTSDLM